MPRNRSTACAKAAFRAFHGTEVVGRIFKRADHSSVEKDVYSVEGSDAGGGRIVR